MLTKELEKKLILKAIEMKEKAYCPYSKYQVGAAILAEKFMVDIILKILLMEHAIVVKEQLYLMEFLKVKENL